MRMVQGFGTLRDDARHHGLVEATRRTCAAHELVQRGAIDPLHRDVPATCLFADVVDLTEVRVRQPHDEPCLVEEHAQHFPVVGDFGQDALDDEMSDCAERTPLSRKQNLRHAATPDAAQNVEAPVTFDGLQIGAGTPALQTIPPRFPANGRFNHGATLLRGAFARRSGRLIVFRSCPHAPDRTSANSAEGRELGSKKTFGDLEHALSGILGR